MSSDRLLRRMLLPYTNLVYFFAKGLKASSLKYPNALLKRVLYVDARKVDAVAALAIKPKKGSFFFLAGDWDKEAKSVEYAFQNKAKYQSARDIYLERIPLAETAEYQDVQREIDRFGAFRGYQTPQDYMESIVALYASIRKDGYKKRTKTLNPWLGEVEVALGRDGKLIKINSGNHRFACAYLSGVQQMPVNLCVVHEDYKKVLEEGGIRLFNKKIEEIVNAL